MYTPQSKGTPFFTTATGSTTVTATIAGVANTTYYICDISASSDSASGALTVKDNGLVIWQDRVGTVPYVVDFTQPIRITMGNTFSITLTGTAVCNVNVSGFSMP